MNRIVMLDELTINKIAAGEVVERPASVIKELVENSIDASASRITVEISDGGKNFIKVSDDGDGILPEDIPLAFQRHSTSKLRKIEDINHLWSNGFRGEALSSIAAVAKVQMLTNTDERQLGKKVTVLDGEIQSIQDIGVKKGTIIEVSDLFFNIPARKKFLKTNATETTQISDILSRLAIVNHQVAFKYISNGKEIFKTVGNGEMLHAISSIYGRSISDNLIRVEFENKNVKISGYISNTSLYQSNRKKENIFINKRYVRVSPLTFVVENIYKDLIPIGKYPVFFLDIQIEPEFVDPNVHPSKLEIKISSEVDVAEPLTNIIREKLFQASRNFIPEVKIKSYYSDSPIADASNENKAQNRFVYHEFQPATDDNVEVVHKEEISGEQNFSNPKNQPMDFTSEKQSAFSSAESEKRISTPEDIKNEALYNKEETASAPMDKNSSEATVFEREEPYFPSEKTLRGISIKKEEPAVTQEQFFRRDEILDYNQLQIIGVALQTYIVVTYNQSIFMIDQHAAHERILYERILSQLDLMSDEKSFASQELLVADIVEFASFECQRILDNAALLEKLGYIVDDFGFNRIAIRSYPVLFNKEQGMDFFRELVDLILDEKKIDLNRNFEDKIARMACRKAIKANQTIGNDEIRLLFEQLNQCENKYTCPHGRPIFVEFKKYEIEKMFKRIV